MSSFDNNNNVTNFQDLFGDLGKYYRDNRPSYPIEIFSVINEETDKDKRNLALDVAAGNGQCTLGLSKLFKKVIGVEPSLGQLEHAIKADNIEYLQSTAESINLPNESIDCITVASACHWFQIPKFFKEAERLLKPGGSLFIWTYSYLTITNNKVAEDLHQKEYLEKVQKYWDEKPKHHLDTKYRDIIPPFENTKRKDFIFTAKTSISKYIGRLYSQSSYGTYLKDNNIDILPELKKKLLDVYGTTDENLEIIEGEYPIYMIISKK